MKSIFVFMLFLSTTALASLDCVGGSQMTNDYGYRVIVVDQNFHTSTLTVKHQGKILYKMQATSKPEIGLNWSYITEPFTNKNKAPAQIHLYVGKVYTAIQGSFSEGSYLPVVPHLSVVCKEF